MRGFRDLNIGLRLACGFGLLLLLAGLSFGLSGWRFQQLGNTLERIVEEDWTKARAAALIDAQTRANARRTMELLLVTDPTQAQAVRAHIARNKQRIDEALATLERLVRLPEARRHWPPCRPTAPPTCAASPRWLPRCRRATATAPPAAC
ncbi:MAG: MCP four helix bundle domain-containing protein [Burkholderiaceae bacterium]|nr:MCP four helix bundle domain-containing protein [Burkholderiaceae bacterium]